MINIFKTEFWKTVEFPNKTMYHQTIPPYQQLYVYWLKSNAVYFYSLS
jgi:hypothetical protein